MIHIKCSQALVQTFTCLQKPDIWDDTQSDATLVRVQYIQGYSWLRKVQAVFFWWICQRIFIYLFF